MINYKDLYLEHKLKYIKLKGGVKVKNISHKKTVSSKFKKPFKKSTKRKSINTNQHVSRVINKKKQNKIKKFIQKLQQIKKKERLKSFLFQIEISLKLVENVSKNACSVYSGNPIHTCGYTAPTITILLYYFYINRIDSISKYNIIKDTLNDDFFRKINSVVQYFYDNNNVHGMGHIHEIEHHGLSSFYTLIHVPQLNGYKDKDNFLQIGPNLISFMHRSNNITIHHACIFVLEDNHCFIMDSWFDNNSQQSRPITIRPDTYRKNEIIDVLTFISTPTIIQSVKQQKKDHFLKYFMAPITMKLNTTDVIAISLKHEVIKIIFKQHFK